MKKLSKIMFLVILSIMLIFAFSLKVQATNIVPDNEDEYEEVVEDEGTKKDDADKEDSNDEDDNGSKDVAEGEKTEEETKNEETGKQTQNNKPVNEHVQAGAFDSTVCITIAVIAIAAIILAHIKLKKYNY